MWCYLGVIGGTGYLARGRTSVKRNIATSAAACGLCAGVIAPLAFAPTAMAADAPYIPGVDSSVAANGPTLTAPSDVLSSLVPDADSDALVVLVPGTDDTYSPRVNSLVAGRDLTVVQYPESFWPIISGKSGKLPFTAPTYNDSRDVGTANTLKVMEALKDADRVIVYTGYSQGSEALGNAAEQAAAKGLLGSNSTILLVSDPRGPWGVKSKLSRTPFATPLLGLIGVSNDGARNPEDTGDAKVVHVIVQGDPVGHLQWDPLRPVSSVAVNAAGFLAIHSGTGRGSYADLENLEQVATFTSGNSTYQVYDTYHPFALLNAMIYESLGVPVSTEQLESWDKAAEKFYPTQEITAENADPNVPVTKVSSPTTTADETDDAPAVNPVAGKRRLLDDTGQWAEPQPLEGGTSSSSPRHAQVEDGTDVDAETPTEELPPAETPQDETPQDETPTAVEEDAPETQEASGEVSAEEVDAEEVDAAA